MATLTSRRHEAGELANVSLQSELNAKQLTSVRDLLKLAERILRRRRVLNS